MGETRVVQGVVVQGAAVASPTQIPTGGTQVQPNQEASKTGCKDPIFALLFYVNVLAMVVVAAMYGRDAMSAGASYNYSALIYAALVLGGISLVASGFGLLMLMACPELMIKAGLIFSIFVALVWAIYSFLVLQSILFGCLGLGFFCHNFMLCQICLATHSVCCHQYDYSRNRHQSKSRCHIFCRLLYLAIRWVVDDMVDCLCWSLRGVM